MRRRQPLSDTALRHRARIRTISLRLSAAIVLGIGADLTIDTRWLSTALLLAAVLTLALALAGPRRSLLKLLRRRPGHDPADPAPDTDVRARTDTSSTPET